MRLRLFLAVLALVAVSGEAPAQQGEGALLTSLSVDQTSILLQDNNYPSEVTTNRDGSRSLKTKVAGFTTIVNFYGCDAGERCRSIQLRAYFNNPRRRGTDFTNRWNRDKRFVKLYLDNDRDIAAEMDVMVEGGITRRTLFNALDLYGTLLKQVRDEYGK